MSKAVFLDTGVLGFVTHPKANPEARDCVAWLRVLLSAGVEIFVPEICDYELRREYVLNNATRALRHLDELNATVEYVPLDTQIMRRAAQLWAESRKRGQPTADAKELDGDVVLAAQAQVRCDPADDPVIATTNVGHLEQFVTARRWRDIAPT